MAATDKAERKNPISNLLQFFRDSTEEIRKVHRPTKQETVQATIVVFAMIFVLAVLLGAIDLAWGWIMKQILT